MTRQAVSTRATRSRRGQRGQRGQVVILVALASVLMLSATALAVDLSAQASAHRSLQNWTDAAATAGARDCDTACNAKTEVQDALQVLRQNSPWSSTTAWSTSAPLSSCTASLCVLTDYPAPAGYAGYLFSISSPPATPRNAGYNSTNYVEVDASQPASANLAGVVGFRGTRSSGHSIAVDSGPPGPYEYTFFAKIHIGSGNQVERITGDAFVGNGYVPQSAGKAGLCVSETAGPEGASDRDGDAGGAQDSDVDDKGHVVFGVLPPTVGPDPQYGNSGCPGKGALTLQTGSPQGPPANCPVNATPTSYNGGSLWACYQPNPAVPSIPAPSATPGPALCVAGAALVTSATPAGVYSIATGCTVTVDFAAGNVNCVSLLLAAGASVNVNNKKGTNYMTSYGFDPTGDSVAAAAFTNDGLTEPTTACPGRGVNADQSVIWAPNTTSGATALSNSSKGCCSTSLFIGTVYLPGQLVAFSTNQALEDVGSVYCGQWDVQSGNHPNPIVTGDPNTMTGLLPSLALVE